MIDLTPFATAQDKALTAIELLRKGVPTQEEAQALEAQYREAFAEQEQWLKENQALLLADSTQDAEND